MEKEISRNSSCYSVLGGNEACELNVTANICEDNYGIKTSCDKRGRNGNCGDTKFQCPYINRAKEKLAREFFDDLDLRNNSDSNLESRL